MAKYDCNIIVCDTETGGLSCEKNPIIEIACCAINQNLEDCGEYQSLINIYDTSKKIEEQALKANGLTLEEVKKGKDSKIVINELIDFFKSQKQGRNLPILAGHNIISFDCGFIAEFFNFHGKNISDYVNSDFFLDTMYWGRMRWFDNSANYKLGTCCENANISLINAHRAMTDTQANKELVKYFLRNLRSEGGSSTKEKRFRDNFKFEF